MPGDFGGMMAWYVYSILTSLSFVGLYLCIRWMTNKGFAPRQILLFMIGLAMLGFLAVAAPSLHRVWSSDQFTGFLKAASFAGIFAAVGHWADFEAIKRAPNPGFATSIRNSSILPVTILSVFLFGSPFDFRKLIGAVLVLIGIVALLVEKKKTPDGNGVRPSSGRQWIVLAFIALTSYTLMVFGIKRATLLGFSAPEICLGIYIVNFVFFVIICRKNIASYFQDKDRLQFFLPVVLVCALFALAVNLLSVKGIQLAPNPGYHEAIRNTNVLFVTLLAIPLFSAGFDRRKMLGVIVIVAGTIAIVV
jgi:drug/metabolite transporter (DMT)-like permease